MLTTRTITHDKEWITHLDDDKTNPTDITADDLLGSDLSEVDEYEVLGMSQEEVERVSEVLEEFSDENLQYFGEIASRASGNNRLLPGRDFDLRQSWRELWYDVQGEWQDRHGRKPAPTPTPKYETDDGIMAVVAATERMKNGWVVEIDTYNMESSNEAGTITAEVSGDEYVWAKYDDSLGVQRRYDDELSWILKGVGEYDGEKFALGPIGEEGLVLFRWNEYEEKWDDERSIGHIRMWPDKTSWRNEV